MVKPQYRHIECPPRSPAVTLGDGAACSAVGESVMQADAAPAVLRAHQTPGWRGRLVKAFGWFRRFVERTENA